MIPAVTPVSSPPALRPVARAQPACVRTDAQGRLALTRDWPGLWREAERFPRIVLQTRHAYARLLGIGALPSLHFRHDAPADIATALFDGGHLRLDFSAWRGAQAWGRLDGCACCGSPGLVRVENADGGEFLQLCASPDTSAVAWADFLLDARDRHPAGPTAWPASPATESRFPLPPAGARLIGHDARALFPLLEILDQADAPIEFRLTTPETIHARVFTPRHVDLEEGVLSAGDAPGHHVQIGLPAVRALALAPTATGCALHLIGPGDTSLLVLAAAPGARAAWQTALHTVFPALR